MCFVYRLCRILAKFSCAAKFATGVNIIIPLACQYDYSLAVNVTYANTQCIFYSMSVNNKGYTSCTIWYNLDTPIAVPLMLEAAMIQM